MESRCRSKSQRFVVKSECRFHNLSRIQRCTRFDPLGIVHDIAFVIDLVIREATPDEHVVRTPGLINSDTSQHSQHLSVQDGVRWPHTGDSPGVGCPEYLSCIPILKAYQDEFVSFRFCEVWHVQLSLGHRARNST